MPKLPLTNVTALDTKALARLSDGVLLAIKKLVDQEEHDSVAYASGVRDTLRWLVSGTSPMALWALLNDGENLLRERHYGALASEAEAIEKARGQLGLEED